MGNASTTERQVFMVQRVYESTSRIGSAFAGSRAHPEFSEENGMQLLEGVSNYNNLRFRLTYNLIGHYKKLGNDCSAKQDAKAAKDMATKARELCNILAEL
ncbi:unnamed protein product [Rotaria sp. Silwood1]|nr:unnamed protein product [Rotaria sp. Silwood1]CAF1653393.1 unnamed protein product [Rotaria sp. Silwood1]